MDKINPEMIWIIKKNSKNWSKISYIINIYKEKKKSEGEKENVLGIDVSSTQRDWKLRERKRG